MSTGDRVRETWSTRIGFILAAVGSAVGLGNIWRFPFQVSQEGGAAFVVMYLLFVLLIGFPAMLVEFVVGRKTGSSTVGALRQFGGESWKYLGGLYVFIGFVILSFYSVVGGWVLRYTVASAQGAYFGEAGSYFGSISTGLGALGFHALFMLLVIAVVALGVKNGIELGVKVMVPAIFAILAILAVYAFSLDGATAGYEFYLGAELDPILSNWQSLVPTAAGQAFFTLSLGMGVMIVYSSYLSDDTNLGADGISIVGLNTGVSILTGLIVFPILFTNNPEFAGTGGGPGAIFVTVAQALPEIPFSRVVGVLFFGTVAIAALSSAISLIEVAVSYVIDEWDVDRLPATVAMGVGIFLLGAPVTADLTLLDLYDQLAATILLITGGILLIVLVTWIHADKAIDELRNGIGSLGRIGSLWLWIVRVPVLIVLLISLYLGILDFAEFLQGDFAEFLSSL